MQCKFCYLCERWELLSASIDVERVEWRGEREDDSPREEIEGGKEEDPFDSPSSSLAAMSVCLAHGERDHS